MGKTSFATHGRLIVTMEDGDKTYYAYDGTGHMAKKSDAIKWKIAGSSDWACTGTIAPAAAAAAKK